MVLYFNCPALTSFSPQLFTLGLLIRLTELSFLLHSTHIPWFTPEVTVNSQTYGEVHRHPKGTCHQSFNILNLSRVSPLH